MQTGEYIAHRQIVDIIREICVERGYTFTSMSDNWLLEIENDNKIERVLGYRFSLNNSVAAGIAQDKVAVHLLLKKAGVPNVSHALLRLPASDSQIQAISAWEKIVVKPLSGSGGYGVKLCSGAEETLAYIESTGHPAWAASPYVEIKREIRCILLDKKPLITYEKTQPVVSEGLKLFNLGQGAVPSDIVPDDGLLALATRAQSALGLRLSAVDIAETPEGERYVLEVNDGFAMEHYAAVSPEHRKRAVKAYEKIVDIVMGS